MPEVDSLRAHHFLCLTTYAGKGYSADFVANMNRVWRAARDGEIGQLAATAEADPICQACPHLQDPGDRRSCAFHGSISARDRKMLAAMGWEDGQRVDFEAAMDHVHAHHLDLMARVCGGCEWVPICRQENFTLRPWAGPSAGNRQDLAGIDEVGIGDHVPVEAVDPGP